MMSVRLMSSLSLTLASCLVMLSYYYDETFSFKEQNTNSEEVLELRVSDIMTDDTVYIEACDNVSEPLDNDR